MKKLLFPLLIALMTSCSESLPLYKDPSATPPERTEDLLKRMTLEEKVQQLRCVWWGRQSLYNEAGELDWDKMAERFGDGLGQWGRISENQTPTYSQDMFMTIEESVRLNNMIQKWFVDSTRLGIPVIIHEEGLHGHAAKGATHFPMPIGLASSWDEELFHEVYTVVAKEIRARGGHQVLAPVLDIVRDPRWGRTEETMGEDPYLNGRLGIAQVKAYQGETGPDGEIGPDHVSVTLKHFGVHGQSEGGSNVGPSFVDENYALETFLRPFRMAFDEAHPHNVMITYNELWGVPSHTNRHLVTDILRDKMGFDGVVVSDYAGVEDALMINIVSEPKEAAYLAFEAGVEVELPEGATYGNLVELVREGRIKESAIDDAVRHVLLEKFRLGIFEDPYIDLEESLSKIATPEHRRLAYKAAAESMVLLQNRGGVLPFDESEIKTIAVIGPNAKVARLGGYTGQPISPVSVYDAVKTGYGDKMNVLYAEGCRMTVPSQWSETNPDRLLPAPESVNRPLVEEAVRVARKADAVILCLGSEEAIAREGYNSMVPGDTPSLELFGMQNELAERIAALGKPTCALIITGSPNNISRVAAAVPSVLQCWFPGEEGGNAIVDAVFGKINPSGKLTISIPRSAGHVPAYYSYKRASRRGYTIGQDITPLYPFGFGLSYTSFEYSGLRLSASEMPVDGSVEVMVDVTNTGSRAGDEIVQMYIRDDISSVSRPVKELRGFERISLEPGETKTVRFVIDSSSLEFYDISLELVVEPGTFTVMVGPSSAENESVTLLVR